MSIADLANMDAFLIRAVVSTNYDQHFLSGSLYGLVFGVAVGYALIALAIDT